LVEVAAAVSLTTTGDGDRSLGADAGGGDGDGGVTLISLSTLVGSAVAVDAAVASLSDIVYDYTKINPLATGLNIYLN
jgi:hypothetical protein